MATGSNIELKLRIQADLNSARQAIDDLEKRLVVTTASAKKLSNAGDAAAAGMDHAARSAKAADAAFSRTRAGVESISTQLARLQSVAGAVTGLTLGAGLFKSIATTADEYTNLNARVKLVSDSGEQARTTFASVSDMASQTGQRIAATAELYTRLARSLRGAASQTELLRVTETISKAAVVSGATAEESSAAIIQLSQGLASGTLRGEEFNSVSEQMPRIMDMLSKSLGKTRGELRAMAADGKLTTEVVFRALQDGAADIDAEFSQMPLTIERAVTELTNAWTGYVGGADNALGTSRALAGVISGLAGNLDTLMTVVTGAAVVMGGRHVAAFIAAIQAARGLKVETAALAAAELAQSRAAVAAAQAEMKRAAAAGAMAPGRRLAAENAMTAALTRQAAAETALTAATRTRSLAASVGSGLLSLAGGPAGLAITGVTLAVTGLSAAYAASRQKEAELEQQHRQTIQTLEDQRQKTLALMSAEGQLRGSAGTSDVLSQSRSNASTLSTDAAKLAALEQRAESLRTSLSVLTSTPDITGFGIISAGPLSSELAKLEKQIDELKPKFEALTEAQATLTTSLDDRLVRALNAADSSGKTLNQTLDTLSAVGPIQWIDEATRSITANETAVAELTGEAAGLEKKLKKELADATYTAAEQLEQLRDRIVIAAAAAGQAPADIDKLRDSLDGIISLQKKVDAASDAKKQAQAEASAAKSRARAAETAAKATENYVAGLEKQAATVGKTQAQVRAYELAEKGLTGALKARAEAALAVISAAERQKQLDADATKNSSLQAQYLRATGDQSGGDLVEMRQQMADLRREFEASGNTDGVAWVDKLIPVQETKIRIDGMKKEIDDLLTYRSQRETSIQAQVQAGLLSEMEGRRELVNLSQEVSDKMAGYLPQMKAFAAVPGEAGESARAAIAQLEAEMARLKTAGDGLAAAFGAGLQSGIEGSLNALAAGTANLSEAVLNLGQSVLSALSQVASKNLAELAMGGLSSAWSSVTGSAATTATETAADAAGATAYGTAITAASTAGAASMGTSLTVGATSITTAMTAGATTLTAALSAAFAAGATTLSAAIAAASAGGAATSGVMAAVTVATGGHIRGPGTGTSDSIAARLSDGEYVINAASVRRYGVDFLHALNAGRIGAFANGGPVSLPPVSRRNVNNSAPAAVSANGMQTGKPEQQPVIQQTLVFDPAQALSAGINSTNGKRAMITFVSANAPTLRQILGVK